MFEPDVLITSPQGSLLSGKANDPQKRLMLAVFEQALLDLDSQSRDIKGRAREWFESEDTQHLFSFSVICHQMNIDPQAAREAVLNDTRRWMIQIRELERPALETLAEAVDFAEIEEMELEEISEDLLAS
ncbi:MAG: hypothetical protein KGZ30_01090 [Anaplasmataceae bacterium]|nr:hypothetical protein [Anaplasmataceae bacterium]